MTPESHVTSDLPAPEPTLDEYKTVGLLMMEEATLQAYRSVFLISEAAMLSVGVLLYDKQDRTMLMLCGIGMVVAAVWLFRGKSKLEHVRFWEKQLKLAESRSDSKSKQYICFRESFPKTPGNIDVLLATTFLISWGLLAFVFCKHGYMVDAIGQPVQVFSVLPGTPDVSADGSIDVHVLMVSAAIILGFGTLVIMFRVERETRVQDEYDLHMYPELGHPSLVPPKINVDTLVKSHIARADRLIIVSIGLAVCVVVLLLGGAPPVAQSVRSVAASLNVASVILQGGYILAILAHYGIAFEPRTTTRNRDSSNAKERAIVRLTFWVAFAVCLFSLSLHFHLLRCCQLHVYGSLF